MPNPNSTEALSLRTQALALLEQAVKIDGLSPYLVTHSHNNGETTYIAWGLSKPDEDEAISILEDEFDPESEGLIVNDATPLKELCGLVPAYRVPDAMAIDSSQEGESESAEEARISALDTAGDLAFRPEPDAKYEATVLGVAGTSALKPEGGGAEIVEVLQASTSHLTEKDVEFLITKGGYIPGSEGYIHIASNEESVYLALNEGDELVGVCDGFRDVAKYARGREIGYIRFDRDAPQVPGCTTYNW